LPGNVLMVMMVSVVAVDVGVEVADEAEEEMVNLSVTDAIGLAILLENVPKEMEAIPEGVVAVEDQSAIVVIGLATLPGSVRRVMEVATEVVVEEVDLEVVVTSVVVDPNATNVTGLAILPANAVKRKIVATSAMALATLQETAARMKIPVITAMRWVILLRTAQMRALKLATSVVVLAIFPGSAQVLVVCRPPVFYIHKPDKGLDS